LSPNVITIVIISTFMHAGWNLLARYERSEGVFYKRMLEITIVVGFIPAVVSELLTRSLTPIAWVCVVGSGTAAGCYLYFLGRAFESSDFTIVYPVARSLPILFIAIGDVLLGKTLTVYGWLGLLLVAAGCVLVPLRSFRDFSLRRYFNPTSLWMLLAAMGTVGYTFLDKLAAETVQSSPATAARYGYIYFTISYIPFMILMRRTHRLDNAPPIRWALSIPATIFGFGAYWLILYAYQLTPYTSYIYAFRQFSIVIGAVLAFVIYKEQGVAVRLTGAGLIVTGLILIGVLGRV
jgi:drug/metabolite transporter (DMT)-like permease